MRRLSTALLLLCFLGLGSGALRFAHDAAHAWDDARRESAARLAGVPVSPHDHHPHDETNCDLHALLNAPLALAHVTPLLVQLGLFVAFLTLLTTPVARLRLPSRIDCRGPPPCLA
jgi:hypothetical protein